MSDHTADLAERIRATIRRYQSTFSENDRSGWIGLFTEDGVLEDPVGANRCDGHAELGAFWDTIHASGHQSFVVPVTTPAVCGLEAAWAFEVHVDAGDVEHVISIVDVAQFTEEGRSGTTGRSGTRRPCRSWQNPTSDAAGIGGAAATLTAISRVPSMASSPEALCPQL